mgnify:CR=1 FL=1
MAELPTPHSIAIGTLIALYSDPNSPLVALDWDSNEVVPAEVDEYNIPQSTTEWSLRLMNLIRRLVTKEDEGVVVLPNDEMFGLHGDGGIGSNPSDDDASSRRDTTHEMMEILDNDEYFFKKHALDGKDILDDVMGLFGSSLPTSSNDAADGQQKQRHDKHSGRNRNSGGSFDFRLESLSTLLDRIDDAFTSSSSTSQRLKKRTLPSLALLSRLQMASTSVDDLMNLLDEWHALLEGSHVGTRNTTGQSTIGIDGESTFGVYLRKLCLGMEEITFEALAILWDALREFVRGEVTIMVERNAKEDCTVDGEEQNFRNIASSWLLSSPQIERIVRKTCLEHDLDSLLRHRGGDENNGSDGNKLSKTSLSPANSPRKYMNLLETHPECPSLHFLLFLSSLVNGQRSAALESLHRYFDYAMIHERKERAERALMLQASEGDGMVATASGSTMASGMGGITGGMTGGIISGASVGGAGAGQRGGGGNQPSGIMFKESNVMQYAAILMAQMYHRFGYTQLSLQATEEAVRVAQQSGDEECVCFANAWLALVSSSVGNTGGSGNRETSTGGFVGRQSVYASVGGFACGSSVRGGYRPLAAAASSSAIGTYARSPQEEEAMLHRCQTRAAERGLTSLAAGASLELARRTAYRRLGAGDDDMEDYGDGGFSNESSLAWDSIQSAGRMPVVGSSSSGHGVRRPGAASGGGRASALQAAPTNIYNMTPNEALSIHSRQTIGVAGLWESTGHSSLASLSSCAALYGSGGLNVVNEETTSSMMMNRVLSSFTIGPGMEVWRKDHEGQVAGESYAEILNHLASLPESKHLSSEWISPASVVLHEWSVRSYDLTVAQGLHTLLANHAAFSPGSDALSAVESSLVFFSQSTLLFLQRAEYDRAKVAARRACWLARRHGLMWHQAWSLLQLALIDLEASTSALSTQPLPPLLECLSLCEQYSMDPLRAIALATLSKILLRMGRHHKARAMLESALPLLMQHGSFWYQGEGCLTLAKCYLAEAASLREGEQQSTVEQGGSGGGGVELSSVGKRKRSPQQQHNEQQHDPLSLELHEKALSELKKAAICFEKIEDTCRLRQSHYLQARVFNTLGIIRQRDEAAKMYSERRGFCLATSHQTGKQWNHLWDVSMKRQR